VHEERCTATRAIPDDNLTESPLFLAGEIAVRRGSVDAAVVLPDEFEHLAPSGPPLVASWPLVKSTRHQGGHEVGFAAVL